MPKEFLSFTLYSALEDTHTGRSYKTSVPILGWGREVLIGMYISIGSLKNTSHEMLDWMKHKLESRLPGETSVTSDTQMTPALWQKVKN